MVHLGNHMKTAEKMHQHAYCASLVPHIEVESSLNECESCFAVSCKKRFATLCANFRLHLNLVQCHAVEFQMNLDAWRFDARGMRVKVYYLDRTGTTLTAISSQQLMASPNAATLEAMICLGEKLVATDAEVRP
jgi:hypothetical protein